MTSTDLDVTNTAILPRVLAELETCEPDMATATVEHIEAAIRYLTKVGDVALLTEWKRAKRKAQIILAHRWPPKPTPGPRGKADDRPALSEGATSDRNNYSAWQATYDVERAFDTPDQIDQLDLDELTDAAIKAKAKERKADPAQLGYLGRKPGNAQRDTSDEWYTPPAIIAQIRQALGGTIDLDPYSSPEANEFVQAERFYTIDDDATGQRWEASSVFMNPPYGRGNIDVAVSAFIERWADRQFRQGVVLVNNVTETDWAQQLWLNATAIAAPRKRIQFVSIDGKESSSNTRGQLIYYFGTATSRFTKAFAGTGAVVVVVAQ